MSPATSAAASATLINYAASMSNHTSQLAETPVLKLGPVGSIIFVVLVGVFLLAVLIIGAVLLKKINEW